MLACTCLSICLHALIPTQAVAVSLGCEKVPLNQSIHLICFLDARRTCLVHSVDFNQGVAEGGFMLSSEVTSLRLHDAAQANVVLDASSPYIDYFKGDHCT